MARALLSVSDKTGIVEFAKGLVELGYELISTGGTAAALEAAGLQVTPVEAVTGFPEMLDGRVKTLHPAIHGGILGRRELPGHREALEAAGIGWIDLVCVNLYPFEQTVSRPGVSFEEAVEQIDIGGPTLLRAAAKNHRDVVVVSNPRQYEAVLSRLRQGEDHPSWRLHQALEAFRHTAYYDAFIAHYLGERDGKDILSFPGELTLPLRLAGELRYGENAHQRAALYWTPDSRPGLLSRARIHQGKELSYNNLNDAQAAWDLVREFRAPAAVAVKHANPCGVAVAEDVETAYRRAYEADPVSIFGGIVALNRPVSAELARSLTEIFLEVVLAPGYSEEALEILARKPKVRVLELDVAQPGAKYEVRRLDGGLLVQTADRTADDPKEWRSVTKREADAEILAGLDFAWRVVKYVKSNAIVVTAAGQTLGVGAGQMNRIDAARIALRAAGDRARGAYLASDAFFPFGDVVEAAAEAGIRAIIQPGGSIRDEESIEAANRAGMVMVFTGRRHFRH